MSSCLLCANPTTPLISMQAKAEEREEYLSELEGTCVALNEEVELANAHKARLAAEGENYAMQVLKNSHSLLPCCSRLLPRLDKIKMREGGWPTAVSNAHASNVHVFFLLRCACVPFRCASSPPSPWSPVCVCVCVCVCALPVCVVAAVAAVAHRCASWCRALPAAPRSSTRRPPRP